MKQNNKASDKIDTKQSTQGTSNTGSSKSNSYNTQNKSNNILNSSDEYDDQWDDEYDKNYQDGRAMRGSDSKKREKKQVDDAFGKRVSKEREQQSEDLHDAKNGGRNDDNRTYQDLNNGNTWRIDSLMDKVGAITGLSGTVLVVYFIISEGTRIIPFRNAIPVP